MGETVSRGLLTLPVNTRRARVGAGAARSGNVGAWVVADYRHLRWHGGEGRHSPRAR